MDDTMITLATFRYAQKANFTCFLLQQEGIHAFVGDANTVTADWFLGNAVGYAKLQVPSSQAAAALEILNAHPELLDVAAAQQSEGGPDTCLACGAVFPQEADTCLKCGWSYGQEITDLADESDSTDL